jgi:signal transduction histidine kinase
MQTERCLGNLLDNAIKFTPAGGAVTVRTGSDGDALTVTTGDGGPGISAEREATLFESFQAGSDTAGRGSTGLGLHIADALVRAMGGSISLDHGQPSGAWFVVRLPRTADPVDIALPPASAAVAGRAA